MPTDDELNGRTNASRTVLAMHEIMARYAAHNLSKAIHERIRGHRGLESTVRVKALHEFLPPSPGVPGSAQSTAWELSQKGMLYEQMDVRFDLSLSMAQAYTKVVDKAICEAAAMTPNSAEGDVGEAFYAAMNLLAANRGESHTAAVHPRHRIDIAHHVRGESGYGFHDPSTAFADTYSPVSWLDVDLLASEAADPPVMYDRSGLLFVYETVQHRIARERDDWARLTDGVAPGPDLLDRWTMMEQSPATSPVWVMAEWDIMRDLWRFAAYASIAAALVEPGLVVRMAAQ